MNHQAKKRFGQNFLHDQGVIDKIVRAINPSPEDNIVEIGPGLGAITGPVLKLVNKLNAVEIDQDVIPNLQNLPDAHSKLTIHQMDALKFDFSTLAQDDTKLRAFGNLPYNISTPLIFHLLSYQSVLKDMHFMLQKEVV